MFKIYEELSKALRTSKLNEIDASLLFILDMIGGFTLHGIMIDAMHDFFLHLVDNGDNGGLVNDIVKSLGELAPCFVDDGPGCHRAQIGGVFGVTENTVTPSIPVWLNVEVFELQAEGYSAETTYRREAGDHVNVVLPSWWDLPDTSRWAQWGRAFRTGCQAAGRRWQELIVFVSFGEPERFECEWLNPTHVLNQLRVIERWTGVGSLSASIAAGTFAALTRQPPLQEPWFLTGLVGEAHTLDRVGDVDVKALILPEQTMEAQEHHLVLPEENKGEVEGRPAACTHPCSEFLGVIKALPRWEFNTHLLLQQLAAQQDTLPLHTLSFARGEADPLLVVDVSQPERVDGDGYEPFLQELVETNAHCVWRCERSIPLQALSRSLERHLAAHQLDMPPRDQRPVLSLSASALFDALYDASSSSTPWQTALGQLRDEGVILGAWGEFARGFDLGNAIVICSGLEVLPRADERELLAHVTDANVSFIALCGPTYNCALRSDQVVRSLFSLFAFCSGRMDAESQSMNLEDLLWLQERGELVAPQVGLSDSLRDAMRHAFRSLGWDVDGVEQICLPAFGQHSMSVLFGVWGRGDGFEVHAVELELALVDRALLSEHSDFGRFRTVGVVVPQWWQLAQTATLAHLDNAFCAGCQLAGVDPERFAAFLYPLNVEGMRWRVPEDGRMNLSGWSHSVALMTYAALRQLPAAHHEWCAHGVVRLDRRGVETSQGEPLMQLPEGYRYILPRHAAVSGAETAHVYHSRNLLDSIRTLGWPEPGER